ncbi:hypothetical protein L484_022245 [Morus notabilis]|uniref:Secreted protein n=1 Tax=Morus notabilis TaxID=981085 RepID=W9SUQ0_9ROSA|nr:hypothetical protein L484_022245 [Morus notabilis]
MTISLVLPALSLLALPVNVVQCRHQSLPSTTIVMLYLPPSLSFVRRLQRRNGDPSFRCRYNCCVASFFFSTAIQP